MTTIIIGKGQGPQESKNNNSKEIYRILILAAILKANKKNSLICFGSSLGTTVIACFITQPIRARVSVQWLCTLRWIGHHRCNVLMRDANMPWDNCCGYESCYRKHTNIRGSNFNVTYSKWNLHIFFVFFWVLLTYLHDFFNPKFRTIRSSFMPHYIPVFHCCFCEHLISKIKVLKILFLNFVKMMIRYTKIKDLFSDFNLWRIIWTEAVIISSHQISI